jgi:precorrin-2/cobalt-factor-2 C20-methyltransferase
MITGRLVGVGVGPGDPEQITVKALKSIRAASVIAYTSAMGRPSLARQTVAEHIAATAKEIKIILPMHTSLEVLQSAYDEGASRISAELEQGRDVALLCEGDPMVYGSFGPILERLCPHYPVEVLSGITSFAAAAALSLQPLTVANECLSVLPATLEQEELALKIRAADTAVILNLMGQLEKIRAILTQLDLLDAATYAQLPSSISAQTTTLSKLEESDLLPLSAILVKKRDSYRQF